ncbi:MAG: SpoIID/LytB domain-containing protein [Planctomycetes bacterium]|nr:SpoIID/LytB domain-containing protein [Planctomycetota bacterium]
MTRNGREASRGDGVASRVKGQPAGGLTVTFGPADIDFAEIDYQIDRPVVDLVPAGGLPIRVKLVDEWKEFRGAIRFCRRPEGGAVIDLVDVEDYLVGVVAAELPANFHREAFRAQAIAARTYTWYACQTTGLRRDWDVWATERSQVYRGIERERLVPQAAPAVRETRGIVCTWAGPAGEKIFCAYYSSRCGGTTAAALNLGENVPIPPLAGGVACPYCRFTVIVEPESIVFTGGRGMGHGKGMCQYGAEAMAQAGETAVSILGHYYPGSRLTRAY